jgi:hypothetical protein
MNFNKPPGYIVSRHTELVCSLFPRTTKNPMPCTSVSTLFYFSSFRACFMVNYYLSSLRLQWHQKPLKCVAETFTVLPIFRYFSDSNTRDSVPHTNAVFTDALRSLIFVSISYLLVKIPHNSSVSFIMLLHSLSPPPPHILNMALHVTVTTPTEGVP